MKLRILTATAMALLLAVPALADIKGYSLSGDNSVLFPTDGTILHPDSVTGRALINDSGNGSPTLLRYRGYTTFLDIVGGTTTSGIPGTTVIIDVQTNAGPSPNQSGSGSTTTTINWSNLVGWTQTGRLNCTSVCPGGCGSASSCIPFVGFEGTGPPAPLKATTFNLDPFTFTGDGSSYTSPSVELVNLSGGAVTANNVTGGTLAGTADLVPSFGIGGLAALGAALVYLGARAVRRRED